MNPIRVVAAGLVPIALLTFAPLASADPVSLFLKANGATIRGEPSVTSLGRADSIECLSFDQTVVTAPDPRDPNRTRRTYSVRIVKRIDKSTPLIHKALVQGSVIEGVFKFYRPNPLGDGTTEQFYTVQISRARVTGITTSNPPDGKKPATEEVTFSLQTIKLVYNNGGIESDDVQ
jgi:type VI secretion system secreted protein Hcp